MRFDRFTIRGQEAVQNAIGVAEKSENQQVEPEHLLTSMLEQEQGVVRPVLGKVGANRNKIVSELEAAIAKHQKVTGGQQYFQHSHKHHFRRSSERGGGDGGRIYFDRASA